MNQELQSTLIAKIIETYRAASDERDKAEEAVKRALVYALECGHYLIEAKTTVARGNWVTWLYENLQTVANFEIRTAYMYMKLAEASPEELKDCHSKKDAYLALGMIRKDQGLIRHINRDPEGTNWISAISNLTIKVEHFFDTRPLCEWAEEERQILVERLRPLARRYVEAGGTL
jgi:hypothetical protein